MAKKDRLTDLEVGQLAWFVFAGNKTDATNARKLIDRHRKATARKHKEQKS